MKRFMRHENVGKSAVRIFHGSNIVLNLIESEVGTEYIFGSCLAFLRAMRLIEFWLQ